MIKNMKVRKSLILGFGVTIVISAVIIIASLLMMSSQKSAYTDIINRHIKASQLITECRLESNIAARYLRDAVLANDPNSALVEEAKGYVNNLDSLIAELGAANPLNDSSLLTNYSVLVDEWKKEAQQIASSITSGRISEAASEITQNCTPKLAAAATASDVLAEALETAKNEVIAEQNRNTTIGIVIIVAVMVIATLIVISMALTIIKGIVIPVEEVRRALNGFSEGKLEIAVNYESQSELGEMCNALRTSQHVLSECISDTCRLLEEMGSGNFDVRTKDESMYVGALSSILKSVRAINRSLSDALSQIGQSAEQVASGADQVSIGSQSLAQGATEQASAVEELSATIAEISSKSRANAQNSEEAMKYSQEAGTQVSESAKYMEEMVTAMGKISESSEEIGKIIATIENIAFQTNILALNAAVEAARAGSAGKGFAVVADEVRNLASKSDEAAKATKVLIENSIESVREGNEIVKNVSASLEKTVASSSEVLHSIGEITKAAEEESEAIAQVTEGIDQISSVVQTNSATSEESAAASEELSSQASLMKELLARFRLRSESGGSSYTPKPAAPSYRASSYVEEDTADVDDGYASNVFSKY
ncbi:MAG: methyl-accepting chemotaxis protein [Oscillospiraceae bacterium]|nr:methyl-accepting chemotaxis protein [Oscillospiraceae bacterium]